ncbi:MAG: hypothetical protein JWQ18_1374 [Conexibacter sp.]|nr:hypothetical protein [Conexibacter sp.]
MSDRRRSATLPVASLAALALAAAGFYGGAEVQKGQGGDTASGAASTRAAGGPPSATAATSATTGTVKSTNNGTLTVTTTDGKAVKVKPTKDATVTRNATSGAAEVHPGDTVVIEGTTASDGTVTATRVTASSSG